MGFWNALFTRSAPTPSLSRLSNSPPPAHLAPSNLGAFARFWEVHPSAYAGFLSMGGGDTLDALRALRVVLRSADDSQAQITRMLDDPNWRHHVVACAAILLSDAPTPFVPALWHRFDAGTWVAPQLAATLRLIDPAFAERARQRVADRCRDPEHGHPLLNHAEPKNFMALVGLLCDLPTAETWARSQLDADDARKIAAADRDQSDRIGLEWLRAVRVQLAQLDS